MLCSSHLTAVTMSPNALKQSPPPCEVDTGKVEGLNLTDRAMQAPHGITPIAL